MNFDIDFVISENIGMYRNNEMLNETRKNHAGKKEKFCGNHKIVSYFSRFLWYVDLCRCGAGTKNPVRNKNTSACVFGLLVFSRAAISLFRRWRAHHALDAWIDHHTDIVSIWCRLVRCMKLLPAPQPQHANNNIFSIENVSSRESLFVSCHGAVVIAILQHGRMFVLRLRCSFE